MVIALPSIEKKYAVILCLFMKVAYLCSHQKDKTYEKDSNDFGSYGSPGQLQQQER